jgi:hypothetical protein
VASSYVCAECGLDYDTINPPDAAVAMRSYPRRFRALLTGFDDDEDADALMRRKPDKETWSALEYTAHVADIFGWMADALRRMRVEDHPSIEWPDQDQRAIDERYNAQRRDDVLSDLDAAAGRLASEIEEAKGDDWKREATFSWGDRDMLTMTRNAVHEGHHHLRDAKRVLAAVRGRPSRDDD